MFTTLNEGSVPSYKTLIHGGKFFVTLVSKDGGVVP